MTEHKSPPRFGTFAPSRAQARIISFTGKLPDTWLGRRTAFALRRLALIGQRNPVDAHVFSHNMRIYPFTNVCEKRILFTPQFFDPAERAQLARVIGKDFVFIDIGANVGAYSLFVASRAAGTPKIVAIEPQPEIFARLTENIGFNPDCVVKAIRCAVTDSDGEIRLFLNAGNQGEASIKSTRAAGRPGGSVTVPARSLLSIAREENLHRIDAIKLDVEGAEDLILVAFFNTAPRHLWPGLIIVENGSGQWQTDCVQLCLDHGYTKVCATRMNVILKFER